MANSVSAQPSLEQLREAFQAGLNSIDDGDGFYPGFHAFLKQHDFELREATPCT